MKEKVYHFRTGSQPFLVPAEISVEGRAHIITTPETEVIYLPERDLELYGTLNLLPATFDTEELAEGKIMPTVHLTKETLEGPTSSWLTGKLGTFGPIPENATEFEIDKREIDKVMQAYEEFRKSLKEFTKETGLFKESKEYKESLEEYESKNKLHMEKYGKILPPFSYSFKSKVNPFNYQEKFNKICEEVFDEVLNFHGEKNLNTDSSIKLKLWSV